MQVESLLTHLSQKDKEFVSRIYAHGLEKYEQRIKAIDFVNKYHVLDAGCGFGQWSMALAKHNVHVSSLELASERIDFCQKIFHAHKIPNISLQQGNIENLPYPNQSFDAIFCYSVLYLCNWKEALKEFFRVLRPNGLVYLCSNDAGWYYHMIINEPNKTAGYNPREAGINAFINEYRYSAEGCIKGERVMNLQVLMGYLAQQHCTLLAAGHEGSCFKNEMNYQSDISKQGFFQGEYFGKRGVYEVVIQGGCA